MIKNVTTIILVLTILCIFPVVQASDNSSTNSLTKAVELGNAGHYEEALMILDDTVLKNDPDNEDAWLYKGILHNTLGEDRDALNAFNKTLTINPKNVEALNYKGLIWINFGQTQEGLDAFTLALSVDSSDSSLWDNKGNALYNLGRYQEAMDAYNKALSLNPNNEFSWRNKGSLLEYLATNKDTLHKFERYQQAMAHYRKSLSLITSDSLRKNNLALNTEIPLQNTLNEYQKNLDAAENSISINADNGKAWNKKGLALTDLGRYPEAVEAFDQALVFDPKNADIFSNKCLALENLGEFGDALDACEKSLSLKAKNPSAWNYKGIALANLGRSQEALEAFDTSLSMYPTKSTTLFNKENLVYGKKSVTDSSPLTPVQNTTTVSTDSPTPVQAMSGSPTTPPTLKQSPPLTGFVFFAICLGILLWNKKYQ